MSREDSTEKTRQLNSFLPVWLYTRVTDLIKQDDGQIKQAAEEAWTVWLTQQESIRQQTDPARAKLIRTMRNNLEFLAAVASIDVLQIASENLAVPVRIAQASMPQQAEEVPAPRKHA